MGPYNRAWIIVYFPSIFYSHSINILQLHSIYCGDITLSDIIPIHIPSPPTSNLATDRVPWSYLRHIQDDPRSRFFHLLSTQQRLGSWRKPAAHL